MSLVDLGQPSFASNTDRFRRTARVNGRYPPMTILAQADESPLWIRFLIPLIPWVFIFVLVWCIIKWQSMANAKIMRRHMDRVEAKLDRLIEATERRNGGG